MKDIPVFAKRIHELRKERGWSQPQVGEMIGTSGAVVGRYERGAMTPSVEVAQKFARAFGVTVDHLISGHDVAAILGDEEMLSRWQRLEELSPDEKKRILEVVDVFIRDAKAREAYKPN